MGRKQIIIAQIVMALSLISSMQKKPDILGHLALFALVASICGNTLWEVRYGRK